MFCFGQELRCQYFSTLLFYCVQVLKYYRHISSVCVAASHKEVIRMDGKERHHFQLLYRKIIPPMLSPVYEISYSVHIVKELSEESFN